MDASRRLLLNASLLLALTALPVAGQVASQPTPEPVPKVRRPKPAASASVPPSPRATPPPAAAASPVRIGGEIEEPRKLVHVPVTYPEIAKSARVQGIVILECTISARGEVEKVEVLRGIPLLDQAAIDTVKQWRYTPTYLDGVPVPVIMTVTVKFKLTDPPAPTPEPPAGDER